MGWSLLSDVRIAWRSLARSPGYALGIIGTLTLGTAPALTLFSLVNSVLFVPLPARAPERMVLVTERVASLGSTMAPASPANFLDWKREARSFSAMVAVTFDSFTLTGASDPVSLDGARVSADYFPVTGIALVAGRSFTPDEDRPGQAPAVVLSEAVWRRHFGADRALIGKTIEIDGRDHHLVGVARSNFLARHDLWVPLALDPATASRARRYLGVMAELAPGVSVATAQQEIDALALRLAEAYPDANRGAGVKVEPLGERLYANLRPALLGLLAAGSFVLLLACVNVASLMLARGVEREKEIAVRAALGVGRLALARGLLLEALLLVTASVVLGLGFSFAVTSLLAAARLEAIPRLGELGLHTGDFAFGLAMILVATLACALLPIRLALRAQLSESFQGSRRRGGIGRTLRGGLAVVQVALALMLVTGACLTLAGFQRLSRVDLGFEPEGLMSFQLRLLPARYSDEASRRELFRGLLERLRQAPGANEVTLASPMLLAPRTVRRTFVAEDGASPEAQSAGFRVVAPRFFETLRIPLLAGRGFSEADGEGGQRVLVVNQALAAALWPAGSAVGKRLAFDQPKVSVEAAWTVVGVAGDSRQVRLDREVAPEIFASYLQAPPLEAGVLVATAGEPLALARAAREAVRALDPNLALRQLRPFSEVISEALAQPRYGSLLVGLVAALALGLAGAGVYGVVRHGVERRTKELAVRMALGAEQGQILGLVARQGATTVGLGAIVGLAGALGLGRLLSGVVYGIRGVEPGALLVALGLLALAAGVAIAAPARRAARADPAQALRRET